MHTWLILSRWDKPFRVTSRLRCDVFIESWKLIKNSFCHFLSILHHPQAYISAFLGPHFFISYFYSSCQPNIFSHSSSLHDHKYSSTKIFGSQIVFQPLPAKSYLQSFVCEPWRIFVRNYSYANLLSQVFVCRSSFAWLRMQRFVCTSSVPQARSLPTHRPQSLGTVWLTPQPGLFGRLRSISEQMSHRSRKIRAQCERPPIHVLKTQVSCPSVQ